MMILPARLFIRRCSRPDFHANVVDCPQQACIENDWTVIAPREPRPIIASPTNVFAFPHHGRDVPHLAADVLNIASEVLGGGVGRDPQLHPFGHDDLQRGG
jgi:hypothetical protein